MKKESREKKIKHGPTDQGWNRLVIYTLLLLGGAVFTTPFYWMVSTSFKSDSEIMEVPPKWFPKVPDNVRISPFLIAPEKVLPPAGVSDADWKVILPELERFAWNRIVEHEDSNCFRVLIDGESNDSTWEEKMAAVSGNRWSVWRKQMIDAVLSNAMSEVEFTPGEKISREQVAGVVMDRINPKQIDNMLSRSYRSFAIGRLTVETTGRMVFNLVGVQKDAGARWKNLSENLGPLSLTTLGPDSAFEIPYNLTQRDYGSMMLSAELPVSTESIKKITLAVHGDGSYNRLNILVEIASGVYRSADDFLLSSSSWQTAVWSIYSGQVGDITPSIKLVRAPGLVPSVSDSGLVKVTLILSMEPHFTAMVKKFFASYEELLKALPFLLYLRNSVILIVLNVLSQLFSSSLVAYGFSRIRWPGRNLIFGLVLATVMLPGQVTMIPQFLIWRYLGMYDTWFPLWLPSIFGSAFNIFLLRQFFMTLPRDLEDAARVDGCGYFKTYWYVMLPQIKPALITIAIFQFMGTWNNFMGPLIYISSDELAPLALGVFTMEAVNRTGWTLLMAASTLMALPSILIFLFGQKYFIKGVTFTGSKG